MNMKWAVAAAMLSLTLGSEVRAAPIVNGDAVTIATGDVNSSFTVNFNGSVDEVAVAGLTSTATFTLQSVTSVLSGAATEFQFLISLTNNSSGGITSRTSAIGFNTNPNLLGVGSSNQVGHTRILAGGVFTNDNQGQFPNGFGDVEVCLINNTNNCSGGRGGENGGVTTPNTGSLTVVLAVSGVQTSLTLDNFGVRYQSISGNGFDDDSGTGGGTPGTTPPDPVVPVPEPGTLVLLGAGLIGLGLARRRRRPSHEFT